MACHGQFVTGAAEGAGFTGRKLAGFGAVAACLLTASTLEAFEGCIKATLTRGGEVQTWHYSVGTNCIRLERGETNWPFAKNLVARDTGDITLLCRRWATSVGWCGWKSAWVRIFCRWPTVCDTNCIGNSVVRQEHSLYGD